MRALTGSTNARAVHTNAPDKLMNNPNFGTIIARKAVASTRHERRTNDLKRGNEDRVGSRSNKPDFSAMSIAGMNWIGYVHRRPNE